MNKQNPKSIKNNPKIREIVLSSGPAKTVQAKPFKMKPMIKLNVEIINPLVLLIFIYSSVTSIFIIPLFSLNVNINVPVFIPFPL
ncbi:hypothetical protein [Empedobacter falsenii]